MSFIPRAAARRRSCLLTSSFLVPVLSLGISAAKAQQAPSDRLPPIEVSPPGDENRTRAKPVNDVGSGSRRVAPNLSQTTSPGGAPATSPNVSSPGNANATTNRQFAGIVGASTSVITSEDIAHSPAQSIQEIIAQTPGVQLTSLFGGVNGVGTTVDLRGFGAFATANSLVLINGRRLNDIDMAGVEPASATLAYTEFLLATAATGGLGMVFAAMTPCMRLYAWLGAALDASAAGPYAQWVQTYADPSFEALASRLERLLDEHADDRPAVRAAYRRAMHLELAFFDAALLPSG